MTLFDYSKFFTFDTSKKNVGIEFTKWFRHHEKNAFCLILIVSSFTNSRTRPWSGGLVADFMADLLSPYIIWILLFHMPRIMHERKPRRATPPWFHLPSRNAFQFLRRELRNNARSLEEITSRTKVRKLRKFDPLSPLNGRSSTVPESLVLGRSLGFEGWKAFRWPP